eukprot:1020076-Alexandrium_andersonii.AAC.1
MADSDRVRNMARDAPHRELRGPLLRPLLWSRSSSGERLERLYIFRKADSGLRRAATLTGLARTMAFISGPSAMCARG